MKCAHLFAEILLRVQGVAGRTLRMERHLSLIFIILDKMERTMSDTKSALLAKLEQLQVQVNAWTTQKGEELAEAHKALADAEARGRAAQKAEDEQAAEADKQAALAKISEISDGLIQFTASGN
jgi:hypothetical protein